MMKKMRFFEVAMGSLVILNLVGCGDSDPKPPENPIIVPAGNSDSEIIPFTHDLRVRQDLEISDLRKYQYFLSDRMVLRRELPRNNRSVGVEGDLILEDARSYDTQTLKKKLECIAVSADSQSITVAFGSGKTMEFTKGSLSRYYPARSSSGHVNYGGHNYDIEGEACHLLIKVTRKRSVISTEGEEKPAKIGETSYLEN